MIVANAKLQIFGDLPKGLSPFLLAQLNFLSDTNNLETLSNDYSSLKEKVDNIPQNGGSGGANSEQIAEINSKIESLQTQIQSLKSYVGTISVPSLDGYLKTADLPDAVRNLLRDYYTKAEIDALLKSLKNN